MDIIARAMVTLAAQCGPIEYFETVGGD